MKNFTETFGLRLRQIRELRGWTQKELGEKANLTNMTISHFECNRRVPSLENFARIANVLKTDTFFLLGLA